jgi:hypothetical protein
MQRAVLAGEPFDGCDLLTGALHEERQAAVHALAVDEDGAGPAGAFVAALLDAGELGLLAQPVEHGNTVLDGDRVRLAVHAKADGAGADHGISPVRQLCALRRSTRRIAAATATPPRALGTETRARPSQVNG